MATVTVDFTQVNGKIKPMHAVNNGPIRQEPHNAGKPENFQTYKEARIPYARNHDASFCASYGGEHIVDVHAIFPNFQANPYDAASYDFDLTDDYLNATVEAGTQIYYRLGTKIEGLRKKYGTIVPADFHKWAVICEHIIRHYNEGWANGFHMNIVYWEIWNEADGVTPHGDQPNWSGTPEEFFELYITAARHLKKRFPHLKIGGPAVSGLNMKWLDRFFPALLAEKEPVPLDFFSWHCYTTDAHHVAEATRNARALLDRYGYTETESILNEWNYVENWTVGWADSVRGIISERGAAFQAATMLACQREPLEMLMYYDARPCTMNGLFDLYFYQPLKGYYAIYQFANLYDMGDSCACDTDDDEVFAAAAKDENSRGMMICRYSPKVGLAPKAVSVKLNAADANSRWKAQWVDADRTMAEETLTATDGTLTLTMPENSFVYLSICD